MVKLQNGYIYCSPCFVTSLTLPFFPQPTLVRLACALKSPAVSAWPNSIPFSSPHSPQPLTSMWCVMLIHYSLSPWRTLLPWLLGYCPILFTSDIKRSLLFLIHLFWVLLFFPFLCALSPFALTSLTISLSPMALNAISMLTYPRFNLQPPLSPELHTPIQFLLSMFTHLLISTSKWIYPILNSLFPCSPQIY